MDIQGACPEPPSPPYYGFTNAFTTLSLMANLYKGIQEDQLRGHRSDPEGTITITFPAIRGAEANKTIIVSNRRGARLHMSECFRMSNKNCCKHPG